MAVAVASFNKKTNSLFWRDGKFKFYYYEEEQSRDQQWLSHNNGLIVFKLCRAGSDQTRPGQARAVLSGSRAVGAVTGRVGPGDHSEPLVVIKQSQSGQGGSQATTSVPHSPHSPHCNYLPSLQPHTGGHCALFYQIFSTTVSGPSLRV